MFHSTFFISIPEFSYHLPYVYISYPYVHYSQSFIHTRLRVSTYIPTLSSSTYLFRYSYINLLTIIATKEQMIAEKLYRFHRDITST